MASELAALDRIVLICGRYEGVDERVGQYLADRELSVGDYVLSGGELGAAVIIDCVTRLIPGAVGNQASTQQESFTNGLQPQAGNGPNSTCTSGGLLDYPHYTRPADFRGMVVPEVLASGNHEEIRRWRRRTALEKTLRNRPDLLKGIALSDADRKLLDERLSFKWRRTGDDARAYTKNRGQDYVEPDHRKAAGQDQTHRPSEIRSGGFRSRPRKNQGRRQGASAGF